MALRHGRNVKVLILLQLSLLLVVELAIRVAAQVISDDCTKSCGGIDIPYPFGIERGCYLEVDGQDPPPFKVTCSSRTLEIFKGSGRYTPLVIKNFSVGDNEMQVMANISRKCLTEQPRSSTLNLPFSYTISSERNALVVVGCNIMALYRGFAFTSPAAGPWPTDQATEKVGATPVTSCDDNINNWSKNVSISSGLHNITVTLHVTGTEAKMYTCNYGFIVDEGEFNFTGKDSFESLDNSKDQALPVVVNWAIGDGNCSTALENTTSYACKAADSTCANQFPTENSRGYFCKCRPGYEGNPYVPDGCKAIDRSNCITRCGNVEVQYPFGLEEDCFMKVPGKDYNPFRLYCDHGSLKFNITTMYPEIINIDFTESELLVMVNTSRICDADKSTTRKSKLRLPPSYTVSDKNMVYTVGCNKLATYKGLVYGREIIKEKPETFGTGGVGLCEADPEKDFPTACEGFGCSRSAMISGQSDISISTVDNPFATSSENSKRWDNEYPCGYGFIVQNGGFNFTGKKSFDELESRTEFPVVVNWAIGDDKCEKVKKKSKKDNACKAVNSTCENGVRGGYFCRCDQGYAGNPYIADGCTDIEECKLEPSICGKNADCQELNGTYRCNCRRGYSNKDKVATSPCEKSETNTPTIMKITLGVCLSFLVVLIVTFVIYREMKKQRAREHKRRNFEKNGGLLLETHGPQRPRIFSLEELEKATKDFSEKIGNGFFYKGTLPDEKRSVAINKSDTIAPVTESNINELIALFQISDPNNEKDQSINIARLLGCCLETERPSLVYEFIGNGTLHDHIHKKNGKGPLSFGLRLNIAAETAESLAHLHQRKIVHRDVKTTHILLDDKLTAKVSDFGASSLVLDDKNKLSTLVQGTLGYLDPEYLQSNTLKEESDVYSFGVVLVELITSKEVISNDRSEAERNLAMFFVSSSHLEEILDHDEIIKEGHYKIAKEVAELAKKCLSVKGADRPSMETVAKELRTLQTTMKNSEGKPDQLRASASYSHTVESGGGDEAR